MLPTTATITPVPASVSSSARQAWQAHQVREHRACELCVHGRSLDGARCCAHIAVASSARRPLPVERARAAHGPCGPEALYLHIHSWGAE